MVLRILLIKERNKGTKEPPVKIVRVDELKAFIEKILERTLRKAAQEQPADGKGVTRQCKR